jgi:hypothetical protein
MHAMFISIASLFEMLYEYGLSPMRVRPLLCGPNQSKVHVMQYNRYLLCNLFKLNILFNLLDELHPGLKWDMPIL